MTRIVLQAGPRSKSAKDLKAKWKVCSWYRLPRELPHRHANLNHRLQRALSWLRRAEHEYEADDLDAAFVFY